MSALSYSGRRVTSADFSAPAVACVSASKGPTRRSTPLPSVTGRCAMKPRSAGQVHVLSSPVIEARKKTGLSQSQFAALIGVSVRTLQGWEQGRKQPSGAARTLLAIASTNPKAVLAVAGR
jgi:putative transcriptional regulator